MWAILVVWLGRVGLRRWRHTPLRSLPSPPRIWTLLVVTPVVVTELMASGARR
jgi:hypothetical protein